MKSVYIAAPYPIRETAVQMMNALEANGVTVTARWLKEANDLNGENANLDLEDVKRADVLLVLNPLAWENAGTGGRHVELGYAIALNKTILLMGDRSNIFHHLNSIIRVSNMLDLMDALQ